MIHGKVWGSTAPLLVTPTVEIHKILTNEGFQCSEHLHQYKWNGFYCISGRVIIHIRKTDYSLIDQTVLNAGDFTTVKPGEYHWFQSLEDSELLEIYYPQHISEDIVRKTVGGMVS
jgi:mannose-6-phosphate isomerase-like protein (cupin superfamily)